MVMTRTVILMLVLLFTIVSAAGQSTSPSPVLQARFVIDENRAYVYLLFDHVGTGVKFSEDEPPKRVWLRFVNNCRVGIVLRSFAAPKGSLKDEVGVMHEVVEDATQVGVHGFQIERSHNSNNTGPTPNSKMPAGYDSEVGSAEIIPPGESVLFSVPVTHVSRSWHMEIPYSFEVPPGKGPRLPTVGGEPKMALLYSAWDLPEDVQQQLSKTR